MADDMAIKFVESSTQTDPVIITSCRKRTNEAVNDSKSATKNEFNLAAKKVLKTNVVLKVMVPNLIVGAILGKKGEDMINMQKKTGAVAKISKVDEFFPGTNERLCLISGEGNSVIEFCGFIIDKVIIMREKWPEIASVNNRPQIKLLVSNTAAGVIIGKNGSFIQEIKESGVYIQLSQKVEGNLVSERCVVLGGSKDQLESAITKIVNAISQDSAFNSLSILSYFGSNPPLPPSNNAYAPKQSWPKAFPPDSFQDNFSVVSMSQTPAISYPLDPKATFTNSTYEQPSFRCIQQTEKEIEKLIEVPESIIGHILGKGGAALTELKSRTFTDIKISKKGVYVPNTNNRWVTIVGSPSNVEYAIRIINESIHTEERRRLMVMEEAKAVTRNFIYN